MESITPNKSPVIPVKLSDPGKTKRFGVVVKNLKDLKEKAHSRLAFSPEVPQESLRLFLEDGTEIVDDDYLLTIHNQIVIVAPANFSFTPSEFICYEA